VNEFRGESLVEFICNIVARLTEKKYECKKVEIVLAICFVEDQTGKQQTPKTPRTTKKFSP